MSSVRALRYVGTLVKSVRAVHRMIDECFTPSPKCFSITKGKSDPRSLSGLEGLAIASLSG
eukprot:2558802-Pyramimonas_sp.AAC.1